MAPYEERTYSSKDGLTLYYRAYGREDAPGTPLLCIPGLTRSSRDFAELAAGLARGRRVLCPDLRGRGRSAYDPNPDNYAVPVELGDVLRLMDHEQVAQTIVLGTSRGGIIAIMMAFLHADRLAGVILNDIGAQISAEGLQRIASYVGKTAAPRDWDDAVQIIRDQNQSQFPSLDDAGWQRLARGIFIERDGVPCLNYDPNISATLRGPSAAVELWPQYQGMKSIPALVLRGEHSDILSAETVTRMKAEKPDLRTVTVKDRGHVPFLDEPEAMQAILAFLVDVDRSQATAATA